MLQTLARPMPLTGASSSAARPKLGLLHVNLIEIGDVLFLALIALGGAIPIVIPQAGSVDIGGISQNFRAYYNVMTALILLTFTWAATRNGFRIPFQLGAARFATFFVAYAVGSLVWGVSPLTRSATDAILLIASLFYTAYLQMHYSQRRLALILSGCFTMLAATSLLMVIFLPQYGIDRTTNAGAWQGAFSQKNALGTAMVLSLVCGLTMPAGHKPWKSMLIGLSLVVLAGSRSRESWVAAAVCVFALGLMRSVLRFRKADRGRIVTVVLIIVAACVGWAASHTDDLLLLMGRDATFSGRTRIWEAVRILIHQRDFLGFGISGVVGTSTWSFVDAWAKFKTGPGSTHSIYLDALLRYGIVGSSILVAALLLGARHAFKALMRRDTGQIELCVLILLAILTCGFAGHGIFAMPNLQIILFFLTLMRLNWVANDDSLRAEMPHGRPPTTCA